MDETNKKLEDKFNQSDLTQEAVFSVFYDYYAPKILRHAMFRLNGSEEAKDVVSQVFLKAWQFISSSENNKVRNSKAFLYQLANNLIIDIYRQKSKATIPLENAEPEAVLAQAGNFEKFEVEQAFKLARSLKQEYRQVISLRYLEEMSIGEIAEILGKNKGSVSVLLFRALREMKNILKRSNY